MVRRVPRRRVGGRRRGGGGTACYGEVVEELDVAAVGVVVEPVEAGDALALGSPHRVNGELTVDAKFRDHLGEAVDAAVGGEDEQRQDTVVELVAHVARVPAGGEEHDRHVVAHAAPQRDGINQPTVESSRDVDRKRYRSLKHLDPHESMTYGTNQPAVCYDLFWCEENGPRARASFDPIGHLGRV